MKCVAGVLEERRVNRASSDGGDSGIGSVGTTLDRSLRLVVGLASFGGVPSLEVYPAHFRPKLAHRRQFGFVSSHFTHRDLLFHAISKDEH